MRPSRAEMKAISLPSGDQAGKASLAGWSVRRVSTAVERSTR